MSVKPFLDTNILVYAFSSNDPRTQKAISLLADGGIVSIQVLNEFVNVSRRKLFRDWEEIEAALDFVGYLTARKRFGPCRRQFNAQRHPFHQPADARDLG